MKKDQVLDFGLSDLPDLHVKGISKRKYLELPFLYKTRELDCLEYEGDNIVEGDIMLLAPKAIQAAPSWKNLWRPKGHIVAIDDSSHDYRWPDGVITYTTQSGVEGLVLNAIAHWEERTPFRFIHLEDSDRDDYVSFIASDQNASYVGRQGDKQIVKLEKTTKPDQPGWAIHEIGHVIGLYHEHCRHDRDQYVKVDLESVRDPVYRSQFKPIKDSAETVGNYDYASQMHYPGNAFALEGYQTITRKDGGTLKKRTGLSLGDIEACKKMYPALAW